MQDQYGDDKAKRIMAKKVSLGLTIADPEEPEDCLYFCLIDIDVKNINEFKKVTSLEAKGMISPEMLTAFTEAGGVMDPTKVKGDMSSQAGMTKALQFMNMPSSDGKSNNKSQIQEGERSKGNNRRQRPGESRDSPGQSKEPDNEGIERCQHVQAGGIQNVAY